MKNIVRSCINYVIIYLNAKIITIESYLSYTFNIKIKARFIVIVKIKIFHKHG
jgi:hypothetical protein